ncbi:MAG: MmcQ/YjbR family DNA-binding protein [Nocardioides sp.]
MSPDQLLAHCLAKPGAWPDNPWDHELPVAKVSDGSGGGKIFAFLGAVGVGVKGGASREEADEWLLRFPGGASVMAYIGRSGWNDLTLDGTIPDEDLLEAVDLSYQLVVAKLPRKHRPDGWELD